MPEFQTVTSEVKDFGGAGFVAVERRRVTDTGRDPSEFLVIARGHYLKDGTQRRRNYVTLPDEAEVKEFVSAALGKV